MKNFKKVMSAVIALAMSLSSFAAVSAAKFTDVADTASYAEAIDVLSALKIVNGYEDGSFKPEGEITRAEAATMIVGALNMTEEAKASAGTSQFDDVNTQASWASGYVNVGVAQGFINGMDEKTFAPQENVTYAQMCVMLTSIAGYGDYAAANKSAGDWSYGYTTMAASVGINKGVAVSKDTKLTRGQVAQMIYNTLTTPKLGVAEYSLTGNTYSQLDGKSGRDFQTLLSEKFDGYVVTAQITDTPQSSATLDNDEVQITITKADYWDGTDSAIPTATIATRAEKVLFESSVDVNGNLFQSGKAIIIIDEMDDYKMIYFSANTRTETQEFDAADYVMQADLAATNKFSATNKIRFGSKYYTMQAPVKVYANGKEYIQAPTDAQLDQLLGNAQGKIKLIKESTDNGYTKIFVDCYDVAKVTNVSYKNGQTVVNFTPATTNVNSSIRKLTVNDDKVEDGDVDIVVKNGDNEIELKNLAKDDIIAYAYDLSTLGSEIIDPKSIVVLVSRDTVSGKATGTDPAEKTYTIDGKEYKCVNYATLGLQLKDSYTLTLDPFGRIYSAEIDGSSKNYGIVERLTDASEKIRIINANGSYKDYEMASTMTVSGAYSSLAAAGIANAPATTPLKNRIVEYTVKNSTGEISSVKFLVATDFTAAALEYKANTERLGGNAVNSSTAVIDASDYVAAGAGARATDYKKAAAFVDATKYKGYYVKDAGSTYLGLVVLTDIGTAFNSESRFAVVRKTPQPDTKDDDDCYRVNVLYNGETTDLYFADNYKVNGVALNSTTPTPYALKAGDAFVFETDSDGFVSDVYTIYTVAGGYTAFNRVPASKYDTTSVDGWSFKWVNDGKDCRLVYGIVTDSKSNGVEFGIIGSDGKINKTISNNETAGTHFYAVDRDAVIYNYDMGDTQSVYTYDKIYDNGAIIASNIDMFETAQNSDIFEATNPVAGENPADYHNYAVALLVNGAVVELYEIIK